MISLNRKIVSKKTKDIYIENELKKKVKTFDLNYFHGKKNYFDEDGNQIITYFNQFLNI